MIFVNDEKMKPWQYLLFGSLAIYLYKASKRNTELEAMGRKPARIGIDTELMSRVAMKYVPPHLQMGGQAQGHIKTALDVVFEKVKK